MNKKRKLALVSTFLALFLALGVLGGVTVAAASIPTSTSTTTSSSSSSNTQPTGGSIEILSYITRVSSQTVSQITPGMAFTLELRLLDPRLVPSKFPGNVPLPVQSYGKLNTSSFTPVNQGSVSYGEPGTYTDRGYEYTISFDVIYSGKGNSFQADIYYGDDVTVFAPLTSINIAINNVVEKKVDDSSSSSSSQVIRGTGFALKEASYGASSVLAGQEFKLSITMLATNGADNVENVSATLVPDQQFTLASGTSTVYFGTAKPNQSIPLEFNMKAASDAKDGSYKVSLHMQGVSARTGEKVETSVDLSIPIAQPDRLVINSFTPPDFISAGMDDGMGVLTANIVNMGKSDISNVMVDIVSEGVRSADGSVYLGTFTPGTQNSVDFTLMGDTPGSYEAEMVVSYENARGETNELREKFTVEVGEPMPTDPIDPMPPEPETASGMPTWGWLLIALGVVAVVVVAVVVVKKRKKAKDAELEDDDDAAI